MFTVEYYKAQSGERFVRFTDGKKVHLLSDVEAYKLAKRLEQVAATVGIQTALAAKTGKCIECGVKVKPDKPRCYLHFKLAVDMRKIDSEIKDDEKFQAWLDAKHGWKCICERCIAIREAIEATRDD